MKEQLYRELEKGEHIRGGDVYAKTHNEVGFDVIGMPYAPSSAYTILRPVSTETATGSVQEGEAERLKLLREHYAGLAMQGLCANSELATKSANVVALYAVQQADALIAALNKKEEGA